VKKSFTIDSPARLHLGFMELNDTNSRVFGSIGLAITNFKFKQSIQINKDFDVICDDKNIKLRIEEIIEFFSKNYKIKKCCNSIITPVLVLYLLILLNYLDSCIFGLIYLVFLHLFSSGVLIRLHLSLLLAEQYQLIENI